MAERTDIPGYDIVRVSWIATALLTLFDVAAAIGPKTLLIPGTVVAVALFLGGCGVFFGAYVLSLRRSRTDAIDLEGLFFLRTAPKTVRRHLLGSTLVQAIVAVTCATLRPAAAAGILAPVSGLALGALWAARHGEFPPR
jgi:uncharacterized membrane protein (DUF441 family)